LFIDGGKVREDSVSSPNIQFSSYIPLLDDVVISFRRNKHWREVAKPKQNNQSWKPVYGTSECLDWTFMYVFSLRSSTTM